MESSPEIPEPVRQLLTEKLDSIEKLEVLTLACRHRTPWTVITASEQLRLPPGIVEAALEGLTRDGLLAYENGTGFQFDPTNPLADAAEKLCAIYDEDRLHVLEVMTRAALERIRSSAATTFADAFRFRKRGKPDG